MGTLIRVITIVQTLAPWFVRILLAVSKAMLVGMGAWWVGVPVAVNRVVNDWHKQATTAGMPSDYDLTFQIGATIVASLAVLICWLLAAHVSVWVFWLVF